MQILKKKHHNISFIDLKLPKFLLAEKQKTITKAIQVQGIGLHTGNKVSMKLNPAPPNSGVVFRISKEGKQVTLGQPMTMLNLPSYVILFSKGNTVSTVEHILSALYGLEIDNVYIDLDSNEVPVGDGSSKIFVDLLKKINYSPEFVQKIY